MLLLGRGFSDKRHDRTDRDEPSVRQEIKRSDSDPKMNASGGKNSISPRRQGTNEFEHRESSGRRGRGSGRGRGGGAGGGNGSLGRTSKDELKDDKISAKPPLTEADRKGEKQVQKDNDASSNLYLGTEKIFLKKLKGHPNLFVIGKFLYSQYGNKEESTEGTEDLFLYRRIFVKSVFVGTIFDCTIQRPN